VKALLGTGLPRTVAGRVDFEALPDDARKFILRFLALMKRSACPATEINAHMVWLQSLRPGSLESPAQSNDGKGRSAVDHA
jgi:hypothetical protein